MNVLNSRRNVTIKDIAQKAGVSRGTVDRVLHNRSGVNAAVAARVKDIARELGFIPNRAGKVLAARKQKIKFACLLPDASIPFFSQVIKGFERAQKELGDFGVTLKLFYAAKYDEKNHIDAIKKISRGKFSGVCLTTLDTPEVQLEVNKIVQKGIPVVSVNTDIPDSGRICYVGTDYFRSGKTAAGMLSLINKEKINALILAGSYNMRGHKERIKGFVSGLESHDADFTVVDKIESFDDDATAYKKTRAALKSNPKINCIFVASAGAGGVCNAVQECARKINVLAFDEVPQVTEFLKNGLIDFTIDQEPEMQGYIGIMRLWSWLMEEGKRDAKDYITQTVIKIAENMDAR